MPHYKDGTPAKIGDLALRHAPWDKTDTAVIITSINAGSTTCNAGAIPVATKQEDSPWYPLGPQAQWTVTLQECMKFDDPTFPPAT